MRRTTRIVAAIAAALAAAGAAGAQERPRQGVTARVAGYADDDSTYVARPHVAGRAWVDEWTIGASYSADVVSSASIDVVTRASRPIEEARHQLEADLSWLGERGATIGGAYLFAIEPDFETHALSLRAGTDLDDERMWHGSVLLTGSTNRIGAVIDPRFEERSYTAQLGLALARIFGPSTLGRATLEGSLTSGFQASAYRTVRLGAWEAARYTGGDPDAGLWVFTGVTGIARERHPELRVRARATIEAVHDLGAAFAVLGRAAGYLDDWGIAAADLSAELRWEPEPALLLRLGARVYVQGSAWFWQARYGSPDGVGGYLTDDKELGPMRSYTIMLAAGIPVDEVRLELRADGTRYEYPSFTLLPEKHALAVQMGVSWAPR